MPVRGRVITFVYPHLEYKARHLVVNNQQDADLYCYDWKKATEKLADLQIIVWPWKRAVPQIVHKL